MKISIVIPAFNVENHIGNTLKSLINQTNKQFEAIIINDGSTDNTLKIAENIMSESDLINYKIISQENGGVSLARNRGLAHAIGKYVLFLDGDDYVASDFVETVFQYINQQEYDVICWAFDTVTEEEKSVQKYFDKYRNKILNMTGIEALTNIFNNYMWICTSSAVYRREFLSEYDLKYTEGCVCGEDLELTFKALTRANNVIFIDKVLSYYVQRRGSITESYNIKRFDAVLAMERAFNYINKQIDIEKEELIIPHYLYHFSLLIKLLQQKGYSHKKCIKVLVSDLDQNYPGLRQEMLSMMKKYKGKDYKLLLKIKAFLISPFFYNFLLDVKIKLNKVSSKVNFME